MIQYYIHCISCVSMKFAFMRGKCVCVWYVKVSPYYMNEIANNNISSNVPCPERLSVQNGKNGNK